MTQSSNFLCHEKGIFADGSMIIKSLKVVNEIKRVSYPVVRKMLVNYLSHLCLLIVQYVRAEMKNNIKH